MLDTNKMIATTDANLTDGATKRAAIRGAAEVSATVINGMFGFLACFLVFGITQTNVELGKTVNSGPIHATGHRRPILTTAKSHSGPIIATFGRT
jgi:hypothetical protein